MIMKRCPVEGGEFGPVQMELWKSFHIGQSMLFRPRVIAFDYYSRISDIFSMEMLTAVFRENVGE